MHRFVSLMTVLFAAAPLASADPHNVFGVWETEAGNSHIQIADCGDGTPCGTVVWINPNDLQPGMTPETVVDANGDNVLGLKMLYGFDKRKNDWRSGTIYDPEAGKTYGSRIKVRNDGKLQVKGCIGPFCQTQVWDKASVLEPYAGGEIDTASQ